MSITVSKVERGAQGSVEWHIENWTADMDLLKNFAKCTLLIATDTEGIATSKPVQLRFSFKEVSNRQQYHLDMGFGATNNTSISLCAELVSGGQPPMAILVNLATGTTNPAPILDKQCTVEGYGTCFTVQENFMYKEVTYNKQGQHFNEFPKHEQLKFKITVTILNFNHTELLTESEDGAMGICYSVGETSLVKDVKVMYSAEENYSDLKIETKDNMTLSAHRFILAARSPGFRKVIDEQSKQKDFSGIIKLPTINAKPLIVVLHWMYTGELHENVAKALDEVMEMCVQFEIPTLLKILDRKLITICTIQNMFQLFQVAQQHGLHTAKDAISDFIKENIGAFTRTHYTGNYKIYYCCIHAYPNTILLVVFFDIHKNRR